MTIGLILLICVAVVVIGVVIGTVLGAGIDENSHLLGAVAGFLISAQVAFWLGLVLVGLHFIVKVW